jgi:hypothetical protein
MMLSSTVPALSLLCISLSLFHPAETLHASSQSKTGLSIVRRAVSDKVEGNQLQEPVIREISLETERKHEAFGLSGWSVLTTDEGEKYFYDSETGMIQWEDPRDAKAQALRPPVHVGEDWKAALLRSAPSKDTIVNKFRACKITRLQKFAHLCRLLFLQSAGVMQMHVYKNGGTTIQSAHQAKGSDAAQFPHGNKPGHYSQDFLKDLINSETWFRTALVRDPMDRALSAFKEVKARLGNAIIFNTTFPPGSKKAAAYARLGYHNDCTIGETGLLDDFERMLNFIEHDDNPSHHVPFGYHFLTQTHFMIDEDGNKFPLDYIGQSNNLLGEEKFLMRDENLQLDYKSGPMNSNAAECRIDKAKLPVRLQRSICRVYLDDYCCFGFALPEACSDMVCPTA